MVRIISFLRFSICLSISLLFFITPAQADKKTAGNQMVSAGGSHSLAVKSDGTLWAWGDNYYGQLGNGNTTDQHSPVQIKLILLKAMPWLHLLLTD